MASKIFWITYVQINCEETWLILCLLMDKHIRRHSVCLVRMPYNYGTGTRGIGSSAFIGKIWSNVHDDVIKWKHFPRYWPFVRGIHRSPVNSPHKGQWRGALMFSLICVWINGWVNNREAGDLRRYRAHYDVTVMSIVTGFCFLVGWRSYSPIVSRVWN